MTPPTKPIGIAVIGAGAMSRKVHLPILRDLSLSGTYRLLAICDINIDAARDASRSFGFERYVHEAKKIFDNDEIEAVFVFGTARMHHEYGLTTLKNDKHLFIEKPPAPTTSNLIEISELAKARKRVAVVGFNRRFDSCLNMVRNEIEANANLSSAEAVFNLPALERRGYYGAANWLAGNGIHAVDALCYVVGSRPSELYSTFNAAIGEAPQNFSALLKWENGTHAVLTSNNSGGARLERYVFHCPGVSYVCEDQKLIKHNRGGKEELDLGRTNETRGFTGEHQEFANAITDGIQPRNSVSRILASQGLVELMEHGHKGTIDWQELLKGDEREGLLPRPLGVGDAKESRDEGILILNPATISDHLPAIAEKFRIFHDEEIHELPDSEKEKIVAVITGTGGRALDEALLSSLPALKVVGIVGASVRKYNPDAIVDAGIPIINASDAYAKAVAEFVIMQAIIGVRNASRSHDSLRAGGWEMYAPPDLKSNFITLLGRLGNTAGLKWLKPAAKTLFKSMGVSVGGGSVRARAGRGSEDNFQGTSIALIGYGVIARHVIDLLQPFKCEIGVVSDYLSDEEAIERGIKKIPLGEALTYKVVSIHRGLSERTANSFGREQIEALQPGAVIINTARGGILDQGALIERLKRGDIFASLDVYDQEPLPHDSILRTLPNVFLTAHISGSTTKMYEDAVSTLVNKVLRFLDGENVPHVIRTREHLRNMT